jgi:hypothetical protein
MEWLSKRRARFLLAPKNQISIGVFLQCRKCLEGSHVSPNSNYKRWEEDKILNLWLKFNMLKGAHPSSARC